MTVFCIHKDYRAVTSYVVVNLCGDKKHSGEFIIVHNLTTEFDMQNRIWVSINTVNSGTSKC